MIRSRKKCPVCKSCTWWLPFQQHRYIVCDFCKDVYRLLPGSKLERIKINEEFDEIPPQINDFLPELWE